MNIIEAAKAMQEGNLVRRAAWRSVAEKLPAPEAIGPDDIGLLCDNTIGYPIWISIQSILAEDWEIA